MGCAGICALSSSATTTEMREIRELDIAETASGEVFTARVDRFRIKDGKIKRRRDYYGAADIYSESYQLSRSCAPTRRR
jgi:hypothetical protein